ncbi:MAG: hypothetical protein IPL35_05425 [Sphingobacteriales bacterium]|nr:hypothetical protein [Sphingobacteriales bacterium]
MNQETLQKSLYEKRLEQFEPFRLAALILGITLLLMLLFRVFGSEKEKMWLFASTGLGFYVWVNAVLGFFNRNWVRYLGRSVLAFIAVLTILMISAYFLSGISILQLREYQLMITAFSLFFFFSIGLVRLIKGIIEFLEQN